VEHQERRELLENYCAQPKSINSLYLYYCRLTVTWNNKDPLVKIYLKKNWCGRIFVKGVERRKWLKSKQNN
jgi:hypothetical protein